MNGKKARRFRKTVAAIQARKDLTPQQKKELIDSLKELGSVPKPKRVGETITANMQARKGRELIIKRPAGMSQEKYKEVRKKQNKYFSRAAKSSVPASFIRLLQEEEERQKRVAKMKQALKDQEEKETNK